MDLASILWFALALLAGYYGMLWISSSGKVA